MKYEIPSTPMSISNGAGATGLVRLFRLEDPGPTWIKDRIMSIGTGIDATWIGLQSELRCRQVKMDVDDAWLAEKASFSDEALRRFWAERPEDGPSLREMVRGVRSLDCRLSVTWLTSRGQRYGTFSALVDFDHPEWAARESEGIRSFVASLCSAMWGNDLNRYISPFGAHVRTLRDHEAEHRFHHILAAITALNVTGTSTELGLKDFADASD